MHKVRIKLKDPKKTYKMADWEDPRHCCITADPPLREAPASSARKPNVQSSLRWDPRRNVSFPQPHLRRFDQSIKNNGTETAAAISWPNNKDLHFFFNNKARRMNECMYEFKANSLEQPKRGHENVFYLHPEETFPIIVLEFQNVYPPRGLQNLRKTTSVVWQDKAALRNLVFIMRDKNFSISLQHCEHR